MTETIRTLAMADVILWFKVCKLPTVFPPVGSPLVGGMTKIQSVI